MTSETKIRKTVGKSSRGSWKKFPSLKKTEDVVQEEVSLKCKDTDVTEFVENTEKLYCKEGCIEFAQLGLFKDAISP